MTVANYSDEVAVKITLWLGVMTTRETALWGRSFRKVESHCCKPSPYGDKDRAEGRHPREQVQFGQFQFSSNFNYNTNIILEE